VKWICKLMSVAVLLFVAGCCGSKCHSWSAEHVTTLSGFAAPECMLYAPDSGVTYITNMDSESKEYWAHDAVAYISTLGEDHQVADKRWLDNGPAGALHSPKGMCLLGNYLYFADVDKLMRCSLADKQIEEVASGFEKANDLCVEGENVWITDTAAGKIFCIAPNGDRREIISPAGVNGITFFGEQMFGVSWTLHEIYELDPTGESEPITFGLAENFTNLDGIEVLDDGTFIVSDLKGNAVYTVGSDRTTVTKIIEITAPADIGLNREDRLLYIPALAAHEVAVYQLK
jgi:hypothetical protein